MHRILHTAAVTGELLLPLIQILKIQEVLTVHPQGGHTLNTTAADNDDDVPLTPSQQLSRLLSRGSFTKAPTYFL